MIKIDPATLVGKGLHRECFEHPDNPNWCVKIIVAGNSNENHREAAYYGQLARRGISWEMLTRFHGLVETNLGEGAVFDLVRDYTGEVSGTLARYLNSEELMTSHGAALAKALTALKAYSSTLVHFTRPSIAALWRLLSGAFARGPCWLPLL